jgi:hypothetical protein
MAMPSAVPRYRRCRGEKQITLGADKGYDTADFVADLRAINVTPHRRRQAEAVGPRRPHHTPRGLRREPVHPQADRGSLRLGQEDRLWWSLSPPG